jgi:uroporphyrinogen decarboxylase
MRKETMTPRERWLAVLKRQKPDRVPMDYWATDEATGRLMKHLGSRSKRKMLEKLHVDFLVKVEPSYKGPKIPDRYDVFGCGYKKMNYGSGVYDECVAHPLAQFNSTEDIERNYTWPNPDWYDYSEIKKQVKGNEMFPIRAGNYEPFLMYKKLRGDEKAYMDLMTNPEMVLYCLDKLFYLAYENLQHILEQIPGKVMVSYVAEDMGGQNDLLFSPAQIQEFFIPRMKKMVEIVHQGGAFAFHHNDGSIRRILPSLIETGIDILNPIQWRCKGMDRIELKKEFGDRVIFHGAMDNQHTLPFGTVDEVKAEVLDNLRILGNGGGYILSPCHNIQAITPAENVVAMYEACYQNGWIK